MINSYVHNLIGFCCGIIFMTVLFKIYSYYWFKKHDDEYVDKICGFDE